MKKHPFFVFCLLFLLAIILNNFNYLLYPYNKLKDLLYYPVKALKNEEVTLSNDLKISIINGLKEDNENLLKLSKLKESLNNFNYIYATIISRNREYWFNNVTINKGKSDGIEVDMAVIDTNGLVGRISSVTDNTAAIKLITTNDTKNKISAVIKNGEEKVYGIISGYDSNNNLLNLIITDNKSIIKESNVETTGMGGVFPSNILIGKVYDTVKDEDGVTNIVRVIPSGNIEGERYVVVLQRKEVMD